MNEAGEKEHKRNYDKKDNEVEEKTRNTSDVRRRERDLHRLIK
jgi:hypothetical protein